MRISIFTTVAPSLLLSLSDCKSPPVYPRHCGGTVRHVHLAVGHEPSTEMIISFASIPSRYRAPVGGILVGTTPSRLAQLFLEDEPASNYNLTASSPHKGNYDGVYYSPHYHHVKVHGLEPSTRYYYRPVVHDSPDALKKKYNLRRANHSATEKELEEMLIESEQTEEDEQEDDGRRHLQSAKIPYDGSAKECPSPDKIRSFRTAPHPGPQSSVNLAIMGDIGQFQHSEETIARMLRSRGDFDALILAGDIGYTNLDHRRWDTFFDFFDDYPIAEQVPLMICPGNHDVDKLKNDDKIFLAYEHRFRMPRVHPPILGVYDGPPGPLNMEKVPYPLPYEWGNAYYSFTYGPARIIMISSYSSMEPDSIQHRWIVNELEAVDRSVTPWVLAVLHAPIYNTFSLHRHDEQMAAGKKNLEPLFVKHKVNMVFTGHIHAYLRTNTVAMDEVHPNGPMHITIGAGGRKCEAPFKNAEPEPWVAVRDATIYGYGMFRILNRTTAEWDWVHTGHNDQRDYNVLWHSNKTLPSGPGRDQVFIQNQFYL